MRSGKQRDKDNRRKRNQIDKYMTKHVDEGEYLIIPSGIRKNSCEIMMRLGLFILKYSNRFSNKNKKKKKINS